MGGGNCTSPSHIEAQITSPRQIEAQVSPALGPRPQPPPRKKNFAKQRGSSPPRDVSLHV